MKIFKRQNDRRSVETRCISRKALARCLGQMSQQLAPRDVGKKEVDVVIVTEGPFPAFNRTSDVINRGFFKSQQTWIMC